MDRNRLEPRFPDEKKLLKKCLARDKKAWDTFVERYNHLISHAIVQTLNKYSFAPRDQEVPDLFNTVFLSIIEDDYKKLKQFQWKCKLSSWLYIIAVRATIDFLRKEPGDLSLNGATPEEKSLREHTTNGNPLPDDIIELNEEKEIIEQTKKMLTSKERFFAELYYICELSPTEIARIMNTTENNVYQLNSRVREKMKKIAEKLL
jgi:RNA polymerase sigma-70 factor (ECF subfamily)